MIAEEDHKAKARTICDLIFGLLDCGMALLLFLPFFGQRIGGNLQEVSLLNLTAVQPYLITAYFILVSVIILLGILSLALQNFSELPVIKNKRMLSIVFSTMGVALFTISQQPYAAIFTFVFLIIKAVMLIKHR